jgi:elongation factor P
MYGPTDLKKGRVIVIDGAPFVVVDYNQKVMGRGGSIVNVKVKNLINGAVIPKTYKGQEKIEAGDVSTQKAQYLYNDGEKAFFMNPETFEQFELALTDAGDVEKYMLEGQEVQLQFFDGRVISVDLPTTVILEVSYTENAVKGDTTTNIQKDAKLETGVEVKVPAFIKVGEKLKIDTRDGSYLSRAN